MPLSPSISSENSPAPPSSAAPEQHCRYRVFLSYSHVDTRWARWLMGKLERYRIPARFHGRSAPIGGVGRRLAPVFRDRDELPTTSDLGETIRNALRQSATLVVICSPDSARSRWVREEIMAFKRLGGERRVFAFIVAGEPKLEGAPDDCFSRALRFELGPDGALSGAPAEVVAADARPQGDGRNVAFVRLVAGLLGVGFDELTQRELQRRNRRLTLIAAGSMAGMALTLGLAALAWQGRNDARRRQEQAEDLLTFMLGDQRKQLERVGRLDVLESTNEKLTSYFALLNPRDLNDATLTNQAKALLQIGEDRMKQARFSDAEQAFGAAYARTAALAARHPRRGEILFERAQAEYWVGFVHWKRGAIPDATEWLTRYRDSTVALLAIDAARPDWLGEMAYGHHNLAVLDLEGGKLDAAQQGFGKELAILARMLAATPADLPLQFRVADAHSWLATVAERNGDLPQATQRFADMVGRLEAIVRADARTARWRAKLADSLGLYASILAITGERAESLVRRNQASALLAALVAADPENRAWQSAAQNFRVKEAWLLHAEGDTAAAMRLGDAAREKLEALATAEPTDRSLAERLAAACRLQAEIRHAFGRADAADAIERARQVLEALIQGGRANIEVITAAAHTELMAGKIAAQNSAERARVHWLSALARVEPYLAQSNDWRILDPAVRALAQLRRTSESHAIIERLQRIGYHPIERWPAEGPSPN